MEKIEFDFSTLKEKIKKTRDQLLSTGSEIDGITDLADNTANEMNSLLQNIIWLEEDTKNLIITNELINYTLEEFNLELNRFLNRKRHNSIVPIVNLSMVVAKTKDVILNHISERNKENTKIANSIELKIAKKRAEEIIIETNESYYKIKEGIEKIEPLIKKLNELEEKQRKLTSAYNIDIEKYKERISFIDVTYEKVTNFVKNITNYDSENKKVSDKISSTEIIAASLEKKINTLENDLDSKHKKLDTILKQSEEVLGKASTAALGQFFKEQYEHSKKFLWIWPSMGLFFLAGAIILCIVTVFPGLTSSKDGVNEVSFIISRIIVSPLFLLGAWFCANQYVKRKNIIEDYAYKKVLSLSLLSFKAEIEKTGEQNTTDFIRAVQNELIKSPLDSLDRKQLKQESALLKSIQSEMMDGLLNNTKKLLNKDNNPEGKK